MAMRISPLRVRLAYEADRPPLHRPRSGTFIKIARDK